MTNRPRIAIVWHQAEDETKARRIRLDGLFRALDACGAVPEPVIYADETADRVRRSLLGTAGALVWVNPITDARDRTVLDALLRDVAAAGVWVSAHPDVVSVLGTKEVLYRTRTLGWGSDVRLYETPVALSEALPSRLASGPLVLKRARGNGGIGVWKIELEASSAPATPSSAVRVEHAADGATRTVALGAFVESLTDYFECGGRVVDQPFLPRVSEGMVRCYLSGRTVAGFSEHRTRGLVSASTPIDRRASALGFAKMMHGPEARRFRALRDALQTEWIPAMLRLLGLQTEALPAIWDADFLRGSHGDGTWVLCEINASCVSPFPDGAADVIARTALERIQARRRAIDGG